VPRFSAFTPFGQLAFTSKPSHAETLYRAIVGAIGPSFDSSAGTHVEASSYARARALARARATLDRAGHQRDPRKTGELLPSLERDFGLTAAATATVHERRRALAVRMLLACGAGRANVEAALRDLLGDDFVAYRTLRATEVQTWPPAPALGPGVFADPRVPAKVFLLQSAIAYPGIATFRYKRPGRDDGARLAANDVAAVQIENGAVAEHVTILSVRDVAGEELSASASFSRPHSAGASIVVGPTPLWTSTQRYALVVVRSARDPEVRRRVHDLMERIARGVSQWAIVEPETPSRVGPFTCATPLGTTTLGAVSIP
jgi:hypothetical protein